MDNTNFYLFFGEYATTGTPNSKTGRFSRYGQVLKFSSRKARLAHMAAMPHYPLILVGSAKAMRKVLGGMSLIACNEYLKSLEIMG